jgi:hypothetical protein
VGQFYTAVYSHIPESRRILKTLLVGRIEFTPIIEAETKGYAFKGKATLGGLLAGTAHSKEDGSPNGNRMLVNPGYPFGIQGLAEVA